MRSLWRRVRRHLSSQPWAADVAASILAWFLRFTNWTNPQHAATNDTQQLIAAQSPAIIALWHGQHLMASFVAPKHISFVALFSRSADAELNAKVAERLGVEVVRGSGGRQAAQMVDKGGAKALIALKRALDQGKSVVMIADISKSTPRQAGNGIITLAKISGRPIIPAAYASSRGFTIAKSWDRMRVNLPFGKAAALAGEPLAVPRDADGAAVERLRAELTSRLNEVTHAAQALLSVKR